MTVQGKIGGVTLCCGVQMSWDPLFCTSIWWKTLFVHGHILLFGTRPTVASSLTDQNYVQLYLFLTTLQKQNKYKTKKSRIWARRLGPSTYQVLPWFHVEVTCSFGIPQGVCHSDQQQQPYVCVCVCVYFKNYERSHPCCGWRCKSSLVVLLHAATKHIFLFDMLVLPLPL